jgi:hypothetical protein
MTCDVCGRDLAERPFYRVSACDKSTAVTCFRVKCGRKAFGIAEDRLAALDGRFYETQRMKKWVEV